MASTLQVVKTPFGNMSFTPDVPSAALQAGEYNSGKNIQTNVRGVQSVLGDQQILSDIVGNVIFVSGGFRINDIWWFVVATLEGRWFGVTATGITNLTPGYNAITNPDAALPGYYADMPITDSWNGTVLFINDSVNPPMYLDYDATQFYQYGAPPDSYIWNYNPAWTALSAGFMRLWSTPNVGSILIAGNLTAQTTLGTTTNFPTTVRWSQAFGLNTAPLTWAPTLTNVANELEIPVRGPVVDGFPCNGNFYICSYWDTVVFQPINYQSTQAPILGVRLLNQGRGLLNENCWANADLVVYGLDARDIWVFDGNTFRSLGNQRVKDWFFANLNPAFSQRTFMVNNTEMNQIEIYFADNNSTNGWCNKMLSYRYDLDIFNAPRDVSSASHACEAPRLVNGAFNLASRGIVYAQGQDTTEIPLPGYSSLPLVQKDTGTTFLNNTPIVAQFRRDNILLAKDYTQQVLLHRVLPEVSGTGNINITVGGALSVGQTATLQDPVTMPITTNDPWIQTQQNDYRVVTVEASSDNTTTNQWQLTALNWQVTPVEDSR